MRLKFSGVRRAQSLAEYAVVIASITAALGVMAIFVNGALQGRIRSMAKQIGDKAYTPGTTSSSSNTTAETSSSEAYSQGITRSEYNETVRSKGWEDTFPY